MRRSAGRGAKGAVARAVAWSALAILGPARAGAQDLPQFPEIDVEVNYVYSTQLGFGGYRVGGLDATVYSLPIQFTVGDVFQNWRLKVALPILYGEYDFDADLPSIDIPDVQLRVHAKQKTLGAEPKLKLEIPVLAPWTVSLIGAWGFGAAFDNEETFTSSDSSIRVRDEEATFWYYTYQIGVSSLLQHHVDRWTFSLGNAFIYAGTAEFRTDEGVQGYGALETGVEARHPLGFRWDGYEPDASAFFIWYYFTPALEFTRVLRDSLEVDNLYEVGLSFGADDVTPFDIPVLGNPRVGVSYRFGTDLDAVRLNFGFPF